jgi:CRISPR-associated protein (TIGR02584 family)
VERIRDELLHPRHGWFHRFCREFRIPAGTIRFEPSGILVPKGANGEPLDDVRTPADNASVADSILSLVRDLTRNPDESLHCSVAGGRKTMGLFLGMAFQLFARSHDSLSHVLVWPPEMEGHREFFYPPARPKTYRVNGKTIRSGEIRVELAEIPVLFLRERVPAIDLETQSYTALVARAQQELDRLAAPPELILDSASRSLRVADQHVSLTPVEFGVYDLLARRRIAGCGDADCPGCPGCSLEAREFLDAGVHGEISRSMTRMAVRDHRATSLSGWQTSGDERFLQVRSRINSKIRKAFGAGRWVDRYCVTAHKSPRGLSRYFIPADPKQIVLD